MKNLNKYFGIECNVNRWRLRTRFFLLAVGGLLLPGCDAILNSLPAVKQIATSINLAMVGRDIESELKRNGEHITRVDIDGTLSKVNGGRDKWGRKIIFLAKTEAAAVDFILISTGDDGELDVYDPSVYFTAAESEVTGKYSADLVYRRGGQVRFARKD